MAKRALIIGLLVALLAGASVVGPAASGSSQVLVSSYQWTDRHPNFVHARIRGNENWERVDPDGAMKLSFGDHAKTGERSVAQCDLAPDDSATLVATLGPETEVEMEELVERVTTRQVTLQRGAVKSKVDGLSRSQRYQVVTPNAVLSARGTLWLTHFPDGTGTDSGNSTAGGDWNLRPPDLGDFARPRSTGCRGRQSAVRTTHDQ